MENLVTAIIPTYKRPELLKRSLASIVNQTYPHLKILVSDNASGDETEAVVKEFAKKDSRIIYHCHSENIGMMGNYQFVLSQVKTPFFSILSDDDLLFPWFFEELMSAHKKYPDAAFYAGSAIAMTPEGKVNRVPLDLWDKEGYFGAGDAISEMADRYPFPSCILFQSKVIDAIPIDMANALVWDVDFLVNIALQFPVYVTKKPCGIFLHHAASYSNTPDLDRWVKSFDRIVQRLKLTADIPVTMQKRKKAADEVNRGLNNMISGYVIYYLMNRHFKHASYASSVYKKRAGLNFKSLIFVFTSRMCVTFPTTFKLLLFARLFKKLYKRLFKQKINDSYMQYAKWL